MKRKVLCEGRMIISLNEEIDNLSTLIFIVTVFVIKGSVHTGDDAWFGAERAVIHLQYYYLLPTYI